MHMPPYIALLSIVCFSSPPPPKHYKINKIHELAALSNRFHKYKCDDMQSLPVMSLFVSEILCLFCPFHMGSDNRGHYAGITPCKCAECFPVWVLGFVIARVFIFG